MTDDDSSREELRRLNERLAHLEEVLRTQTERLYRIENQLGIDFHYRPVSPPPPPPRPRFSPPPPPPPFVEEAAPANEEERAGADFGESAPPPRPYESPYAGREGAVPPAEPRAPRKRRDIESLVGGSLFNWAGIIAVAFTAAFFLKLAIDYNWIGPLARVGTGALVGLGIVGLAEFLRRRGLRQYAYVLTGGGILILYLSVYAARAFYGLVGQPTAFLLMCAVTAAAVTLSVRHDALSIAILGLVGGFATPVLLSTGQDNQVALFTYVALLDAGVLAVAYFKQWRLLNFLAFFATSAMTVGWMDRFYADEKLWPTFFFTTLLFLLFAALAPVHNVLRRHRARWYDVLLIIAAATFYFTLNYSLLDGAGYGRALGLFTFSLSAFYAALFLLTWARHREDRLLRYGYVGAAVTFLTTAAAVQLEQHWVTVAWATEALMLLWVGLRAKEPAARHAAIPVFGVAVAHWLIWDVSGSAFVAGAAREFVPLLNRRAYSCAVLVVALGLAAWLYRRAGEEVAEEERLTVGTFYLLAAVALNLTLLTLDLNDYFYRRLSQAPEDDLVLRRAVESARQFAVAALWTLYGTAALVLGLLRGMRLLRYGALLLLGAAVVRVAMFGIESYAAPWQAPLVNQTFVAYLLLAAALAVCARFYARAAYTPAEEREVAWVVLTFLANLLVLGALSTEAAGYYDRQAALLGDAASAPDQLYQLDNAKWFALTLVWCVYAAAIFWHGWRRGARGGAWRVGALALLVVAAVKTFALDLSYYAASWHAPVVNQTFGSFALIVAALGLVIYLYGRAGEEVSEQERGAVPALVVGANVLAIVALSAEASGHYQAAMRQTGLAESALRDLRLSRGLSLSVVWAVYGGALLAYGHLRGRRLQRLMGLALLGLTTLKVFFLDLSGLDRVYRIISFGVLGLVLLAVSYLYQKSQRAAADAEEAEAAGPS